MMNLPVRCDERDLVTVDPPAGQTCGPYMEQFLSSPQSTGYIDNPEATSHCNYCQFSSGRQYYSVTFQWSELHRWRNFGMYQLIDNTSSLPAFSIMIMIAIFYII